MHVLSSFQSILPPSMSEYQRLRCRVAFQALHFRPEIQVLGRRMVERLRDWGQPFLAFHPGLVRDALAYHGCAELFQDVHTELIQYRRAQLIKQGIVKEEPSVDSHLHKEKGLCPLMPEEVYLGLEEGRWKKMEFGECVRGVDWRLACTGSKQSGALHPSSRTGGEGGGQGAMLAIEKWAIHPKENVRAGQFLPEGRFAAWIALWFLEQQAQRSLGAVSNTPMVVEVMDEAASLKAATAFIAFKSHEYSYTVYIRFLGLLTGEVGILLRAMGYPPKTIIYLAGSETFGGQRVLIPLRAMFANLVDRTSLCSSQELLDLVGPETPLPLDTFKFPPAKTEEQLKEEWKKAGPRPRPLPPPPDRPIYRHEKEGWYDWITETETEPDPSPMDLRMEAHRLLWDALDYIVSVEADAFFPGFNNDGIGWPDFSSLVMGQRLYENPSSRTYRPDRKILADLFNITRENMYHPKHNWTLSVQELLNKSMGEEGLIRESLLSKPNSFLSHPLPECSCRIPSDEIPNQVKGNDGRLLYGGEDNCPEWMQRGMEMVKVDPGATERSKDDEVELPDYETDLDEQPENDDTSGNTNTTLPFDQDDEMDPND
ncbi:Protein embryo sac development arrest 30 [Vitis vinifera]|uniref:O-fucosyltransferase family protein n=1 Tax=Vitis vinifera TaxID=29760 RepID=A0A438D8R0_VITVI|nr:Protein embryo sac development arrest 30 [Vitis vinifera]